MRYLCIYSPAKPEGERIPSQEEMEAMGKLIEEMSGKGVLESTEGCLSSAKGGHVRLAGGGFSVTDGPFTEAKEIVGGFAIIRANSKEEALGHIKQFLNVAGDGVVEFRQLYEAGDFGG